MPALCKVVNCIVLGHGDGIKVTLPPENSVAQLKKIIKARKGLPRWTKLDLYRSYDPTTSSWHAVTDEDAHALGALTEGTEIERAVAAYSVVDRGLQVGCPEFDLPEEHRHKDQTVQVLAVIPARACK
ncbi:hypothetical protein P3T76_004367 [Phytophthora citrophthora]|uniref:Uncharacterized protein n=1 Tax=Phytophthora citrophthora TaxID=4793 RepID=A0AAD9GTB0_9STRA|nr:hypothetical protein P3T76_004367 [Phytophthora citrophthora]